MSHSYLVSFLNRVFLLKLHYEFLQIVKCNRCISEMSDCISVSDCKACPVRSRATGSKQKLVRPFFLGGGWADESYGPYCVGISHEILKAKRVVPAEELDSSSCLLCGKDKLQILFLKRGCLLICPSQKWLFAPALGSLHLAAALCAAMAVVCIYAYASVNWFILKGKVVCVHNNLKYWNKSQSVKNAGILLISFSPVYCILKSYLTVPTIKPSVSCSTCLVFFV